MSAVNDHRVQYYTLTSIHRSAFGVAGSRAGWVFGGVWVSGGASK
jgi:hypothetical protein